jgi:Uma2 family endonuclease
MADRERIASWNPKRVAWARPIAYIRAMARATPTPPAPWTVEEFLAWERDQPERYEFYSGFIRMMVGGTLDHNTIAGNIMATLRSRLRGGPCRAFTECKVTSRSELMYPDVVITCSAVDAKSDVVPEPVAVFEVLSRSTESFDRGQKWLAYQSILSLRQYVLVSQDELRVDVYDRTEAGWSYRVSSGPAATLELAADQVRLTMAEIYEGSSLDPAQTATA